MVGRRRSASRPRLSTIAARARRSAAARIPHRQRWQIAAVAVAAGVLLVGLATAGVATGRVLDVTDTTTTDTTSTDTTTTDTTTTDTTTTDTTTTDTTTTDTTTTDTTTTETTPTDTTPPTLNLPSAVTAEATGPGGAPVTYQASATDDVDGPVPISCSPSSGSTFVLGTTPVGCSAQDSAGNKATGSFTVTVQDTTPPTLSLSPPPPTTATGPSGAVVTYSATANDTVDGPVTPSCSPASGSTFPVGTTPVHCTAQDAHGNTASGNFGVTVLPQPDTTPPTLNLPSPITQPATGPSGAVVPYTVTANDAHDGPVAASCAPASGSTFPVGTTTVNCSAQDAAGNKATGSFTVTVVDTTPPTLTLPAPITVNATGLAGAYVTFTASANDLVDGQLTPTCAPASGALFAVGTTTVSCTAVDGAGNSASGTFTVTVRPLPVTAPPTPGDKTPPVITVPGPMTVHAPGPPGTTVDYSVSAVDAAAGKVPVACTPAPGSTFPIGSTSVTCSATDANGNTASRTFTVNVVDVTPPPAVTGLSVKTGKGSAVLHWQNPASSDFDHVEIDRIRLPSGAPAVLYRGGGATFSDENLADGVNYEYIVFAVDAQGNRAGVAVTVRPRALVLLKPNDGAAVKSPPLLAWVAAPKADYYNLQLYRGATKVLSVWPRTTHFQLGARWRFSGHAESLAPGLYRWYVFPGYGARSARSFGGVLGPSTFVVNG